MILLRYFSREIFNNTVGVSLVLLLVFLSQRFVKYLANAASGDIDPAALLPLIAYRIPGMLELIIPLGLFVALLLAYGRLYLDNEMRVLFAAGISRWRLLLITMIPVCILAVAVGFISLWLSPHSFARVQTLLQMQEDRSELDSLVEGRFHSFRSGSGVIYVEEMYDAPKETSKSPDEQESAEESIGKYMKGVYIFQHDEQTLDEVLVVAEHGRQINNKNGRYLLLEDGYRLHSVYESQSYERVDFARYGQQVRVESSDEYQSLKVNALPTRVLRDSDRAEYRAVWQWRVSLIFLVPVVALLAMAFGKADARQGRYFKVLPAILIYLVYLVLLNMVRDYISSGGSFFINPFAVVHLLFALAGLIILFWDDIDRRFFWSVKS